MWGFSPLLEAAAADLALKKQGVARQVRQNTLQTIQNAAAGSTLIRWQTELAQEHNDELNSTEGMGTYVRPSEERQEEVRKENEKKAQKIAQLDKREKPFNGKTVDS